jgi:hypothetical protein
MALEYVARIGPAFSPDRLVNAAQLEDLAVVLSASEEQVLLRWADAPARMDWPEDIAIARHPGGLLVQFHTGGREQCGAFLQEITCVLQQMSGEPVEFEEP